MENTCHSELQRPLTIEELENYFYNDNPKLIGSHIFVEAMDCHLVYAAILDRYDEFEATWNCRAGGNFMQSDYGTTWRAWLRFPSEEEIKSAG